MRDRCKLVYYRVAQMINIRGEWAILTYSVLSVGGSSKIRCIVTLYGLLWVMHALFVREPVPVWGGALAHMMRQAGMGCNGGAQVKILD